MLKISWFTMQSNPKPYGNRRGKNTAPPARRAFPTIVLRSIGRIRGCERRQPAGPRSGYQPTTSASVMRVIAIRAQTARKRLDRSVRCAENTDPSPEHSGSRSDPPALAACATAHGAQGKKTIVQMAKSGDLDVWRQVTWGMSVQV